MHRVILLLAMSVATSFAESRYTDAMYRKAIIDESIAPLYVLFTFHDAKTGQDRVICTLGNLLVGAIHMEYHLDYDRAGEKRGLAIAVNQPGHRFTFKNSKALRNIESLYTSEMLNQAQHYLGTMSDAQARRSVDNGQLDNWCHNRLPQQQWDNCQAAIAHVLLERGILVGQGDRAPELYLER
jgi:hypothetical protein